MFIFRLPISKYVGVPMLIRNFPMLAGFRLLTSKIASHQSTTRDTGIHMTPGKSVVPVVW